MVASARAGCDLCTFCWHHVASQISEGEYKEQPMRLCRHYGENNTSGPVQFELHARGRMPFIDDYDPED